MDSKPANGPNLAFLLNPHPLKRSLEMSSRTDLLGLAVQIEGGAGRCRRRRLPEAFAERSRSRSRRERGSCRIRAIDMQRYRRLLTTHALTAARVSPSTCATCGSTEALAARAVESGRPVCCHDSLDASWPRPLIPLSHSLHERD